MSIQNLVCGAVLMALLSGESQAGGCQALLPVCPDTPNCVSSQAQDSNHRVAPFVLKVKSTEGWDAFKRILANQPRTRITQQSEQALHAEETSRIFGFVDDIDAVWDETTGVIHIRSASRVGYSDLGVNRKRVERLRQQLQQHNIID